MDAYISVLYFTTRCEFRQSARRRVVHTLHKKLSIQANRNPNPIFIALINRLKINKTDLIFLGLKLDLNKENGRRALLFGESLVRFKTFRSLQR